MSSSAFLVFFDFKGADRESVLGVMLSSVRFFVLPSVYSVLSSVEWWKEKLVMGQCAQCRAVLVGFIENQSALDF